MQVKADLCGRLMEVVDGFGRSASDVCVSQSYCSVEICGVGHFSFGGVHGCSVFSECG